MSAPLTEFLKQLDLLPTREISVGMGGVELSSPSNIPAEQVGYSTSPEGADLCGSGQGDWRRSWVVFGHETLCGDPLFVDVDAPGFPVYTAAHGEGSWEPELVSDSFASFAITMLEVSRLSTDRGGSDLEDKPLSRSERKALTKKLTRLSPKAESDFWLGLFDAG